MLWNLDSESKGPDIFVSSYVSHNVMKKIQMKRKENMLSALPAKILGR